MKYYYFVREKDGSLYPRKKFIYAIKPETALHYALNNVKPVNPDSIIMVCDNGLIYRAFRDVDKWLIRLMQEVKYGNISNSPVE